MPTPDVSRKGRLYDHMEQLPRTTGKLLKTGSIVKTMPRSWEIVDGLSKQPPFCGKTRAVNGKTAINSANSSVNHLDRNHWVPSKKLGIWIWGGGHWLYGDRFYELLLNTDAEGKPVFNKKGERVYFKLGRTWTIEKLSLSC